MNKNKINILKALKNGHIAALRKDGGWKWLEKWDNCPSLKNIDVASLFRVLD